MLFARSSFLRLVSLSLGKIAPTVLLALVISARAQEATTPTIEVHGQAVASPTPSQDDFRAKLDHIMREVEGTQITVTKKATTIKLEQQPVIINNNTQEVFNRAPGLLVGEQNTPSQFNLSYRGLGNPQESEYVNVLQDGMSIMSDWIGYPTLYYSPLPQSISEIQVIRGGGSLLYGPEPAPAVNFVSRRPDANIPLTFGTEQIGGAYGLYSTYNFFEGTSGPLQYLADFGYVRSDGQRENSAYDLWQGDLYVGYSPREKQTFWMDVRTYHLNAESPGRINAVQFKQDRDASLTPFNNEWVDRYHVTLGYDHEFGNWLLQAKAWYTFLELDSRTAGNLTVLPNGTVRFPATTQFQYEDFSHFGADIRLRLKWGEGTILRGSALTFGATVFHSDAPYEQYILNLANTGADYLTAPRGTKSEAPFIRLIQDRNSDYHAFFAENVFRFGKFHIVPSFRLDHEEVEVREIVSPFRPRPGRPLAHVDEERWVPLWGIGLGNDFGHLNETYFSASTGWRPLRYFDVVSPFSPTFVPGNPSDPFESLDLELGVHGTPLKGFWYDVGLFWMEFDNRTENQFLNPGVNNDTILANSGSSRHRGFEGEASYDIFALCDHPALANQHLIIAGNLQLLDAEFTESQTLVPGTTRTLVGNEPAFAPDVVAKWSLTYRIDKRASISVSGVYVSEQFWQDNNLPFPTTGTTVLIPAEVPSYVVWNLTGQFDITKNIRLIAGVTNLADENYYSRVFGNGLEPAPRRSGYAGIRLTF